MSLSIIKKIYADRVKFREQAEAAAFLLEDDTIKSDEEYARLRMVARSTIIEAARCGLGANGKVAVAERNLQDYIKYRGYDFAPKYKCAKCKDKLGYDGNQCACVRQEIKQAVLDQCGIRSSNRHSFSEVDFSIIPNLEQRKELEGIYQDLSGYCDKFKMRAIGYTPKNVMLAGSAGLGKTFLLECICSDANAKGLVGLYFKAFELNAYFLKIRCADFADKNEMWDLLYNCDLLFIDDLGTEDILEKVTREYMFNLIDHRYSYSKPYFLSTNLNYSQLIEKYAERTVSRMLDKKKTMSYWLEGKDLRIVGGGK